MINENMSGISKEAVLVHDCWKAHLQTPVKKNQLRTDHLERETVYLEHVFTFLFHPDVPPDNNGSERAIRNVKVKQKISGKFKILNAAENFVILRSITDTIIKNIQNMEEALSVIAACKSN